MEKFIIVVTKDLTENVEFVIIVPEEVSHLVKVTVDVQHKRLSLLTHLKQEEE